MGHRASRRPNVSVVLAASDGADHLVRAVESVLNQSYSDFELLTVDCASHDRTASILSSFHDRDIRVEVIERDDSALASGAVEALDRARGAYVMFVRPEDWLAPNALGNLVEFAEEHRLDIAAPMRSDDVWDARDRSSSSQHRRAAACVLDGRDAVRHGMSDLYEQGLLSQATGLLIERMRAVDHRLALATDDEGLGFVIACLEDAERIGACDTACYHRVAFGKKGQRTFDPAFMSRCANEHTQMMGLVRRWGLDCDPDVVVPLHRRHVRRLIECIDNTTVGKSRVSSIERLGRVQEMLNAEDARASLAAVKPAASDFGIMYKPMTQGNAAACCMGSHLREFARQSHLPLFAQR